MRKIDAENAPLELPAIRSITFPPEQLPTDFFAATVDRVIDGDSAWLFIDLNFDGITAHRNCRFLGIQAPDKQPAKQASKLAAMSFLEPPERVVVYVPGIDKYGRPLVVVYVPELEISLNEWLLEQAYAVPYDGQSPKPNTIGR